MTECGINSHGFSYPSHPFGEARNSGWKIVIVIRDDFLRVRTHYVDGIVDLDIGFQDWHVSSGKIAVDAGFRIKKFIKNPCAFDSVIQNLCGQVLLVTDG